MKLRPYQVDAVQAVREEWDGGNRNALIVMATGLGKALRVDQRVLTPGGWRPIGSLAVGDEVIGKNGRPTLVEGVYPQGVRDLYEVETNDGAIVVCDGEHLWTVRTKHDKRRGRDWRTFTLNELIKRGIDEGAGSRWEIPSVDPIDGGWPLPVDPYVFGALLGDGHFSVMGSLKLTAEPDLLNLIGERLKAPMRLQRICDAGKAITVGLSSDIGRGDNRYLSAVRAWGLEGKKSAEKFIPPSCFLAPPEDRLELLRGLMDTDGYPRKDGGCEFTVASEALAGGVRDLVRGLGGLASMKHKSTTWVHLGERRHGHAWRVSIAMSVCPFKWKATRWVERTKYMPTRKIKAVRPAAAGEAVCIKVAADDGLFVTEGHVVTHNTIVFVSLGDQLRREGLRRVLVLAHRRELVQQAFRKWQQVAPQENVGIFMGARKDVDADIIIASVASCYPDKHKTRPCDSCGEVVQVSNPGQPLKQERRAGPGCPACGEAGEVTELVRRGRVHDLPLDEIDLIVVDEAHHITRESLYMAVLDAVRERNPLAFFLGVTATPHRADKRGFGWLFDGVPFCMGIRAGIDAGWLAPFSADSVRVELDVDLSKVRVSDRTGDFVVDDLGEALDTDDARREIVLSWRRVAGPGVRGPDDPGRKTVVFVPTVDFAEHLCATFQDHGLAVSWICGDGRRVSKDERARRLARYARGELRVMINVGVLTEGWDDPATDCIAIARPTKSAGLWAQMIGRGTRIVGANIEESRRNGKADCLVVDYVGAAALGLCSLADLSRDPPKEELVRELLDQDEEDEQPLLPDLDFPDAIETVKVDGHRLYQIDLFSGRVAWVWINGSRVASLSMGLAVVVFTHGGGFSVIASGRGRAGVEWLAEAAPEMDAMKIAERYAVENGGERWLNPSTWVRNRAMSKQQSSTLAKLARAHGRAMKVAGGDPALPIDGRIGSLSMAEASAWIGYLEVRLAFLAYRAAA